MIQESLSARYALALFVMISALVVVSGCGGEKSYVPEISAELELIYEEPKESEYPWLVTPRDIIIHDSRLYVLDGKLSTVGVFDAQTGRPITKFGGYGEGPGELGKFTFGLVSDGERIGVFHALYISWFTKEGSFIEREQFPSIVDFSAPSIHYTNKGVLFNVGYHGPKSPLAIFISTDGDTVEFGKVRAPANNDPTGLFSNRLNFVRGIRYPNGNILLAHVQQDLLEFYSPDRTLITNDSWGKFTKKMRRNENGLLWGHPGLSMSVVLDQDGFAYVLGGETSQTVLMYDSKGTLLRRFNLDKRTFKIAWKTSNEAFALTGADKLYRLVFQSVEDTLARR